jgi:hypothetical protein
MNRRFRATIFLALLSVVLTQGVALASMELPRVIDRALKHTVLTSDFDSPVDRVNRVKTELFMASYHLRAVGYGFHRNAGATGQWAVYNVDGSTMHPNDMLPESRKNQKGFLLLGPDKQGLARRRRGGADDRCRHAACGARGAPARRGGGRGRS